MSDKRSKSQLRARISELLKNKDERWDEERRNLKSQVKWLASSSDKARHSEWANRSRAEAAAQYLVGLLMGASGEMPTLSVIESMPIAEDHVSLPAADTQLLWKVGKSSRSLLFEAIADHLASTIGKSVQFTRTIIATKVDKP